MTNIYGHRTRLVGVVVLAALCWPLRGALFACLNKRNQSSYSDTDPGQNIIAPPSTAPTPTPTPLLPPTTFVLSTASPTVPASIGSVEVTVRALDAGGDAMAGQPVVLGVLRGLARLDATTGVTDNKGLFATTARAPAAGTVGIFASIGDQNRTTMVTFVRACNGNVGFASPVSLPMNLSGLRSLALGDLNNDAIYDVIALGDGNRLTPMLGDGLGSLRAMSSVQRGDRSMAAMSATAVDVTGDGLADAVTSYYAQDSIGVWVGDGSGGFAGWYNLPYASYQKPAVGDLDNDGRVDIVSATDQSNQVAVGFSQATGGFGPATLYSLSGGTLGRSAWSALGDFDGDSQPDIVVGNGNSTSDISIVLNGGKRAFRTAQTLNLAPYLALVTTADFNDDDISDVVATSTQSPGMYVSLGKGDGTFQAPTQYATVAANTVARAADLDGDGDMDIVAVAYSSTAYIYVNPGNGRFPATALQVTVNAGTNGFVLADVDGDGRIDIVSPTSDGVAVTPNTCD